MSELCKGNLVLWNDEKGFGFVRPESGEKDFFLHISAITNYRKGLSRRPAVGDVVHYQPVRSAEAQGQRRLSQAIVMGLNEGALGFDTDAGETKLASVGIKLVVGAPILLSIYVLWHIGNPIPLFSYVFMSALSTLYYGADKQRALTHGWRIPEKYLHVFELLGGWPGALLSQKAFRHKYKKSDYQRIFWGIIGLHGLLWAVYLYFDLMK
ncbi:MAG: DUF1294 domain-containing protein [Methylococcaceae bacterium]|nr:DUF1294 domain-containing protein [Methylococcaceae bacterium]